MTKNDIVRLLFPGIFFAVVAIAAFYSSNMIQQRTNDRGSEQKFESFVRKVRSGERQLTTDQWLEGMRLEFAAAESYRKVVNDTAALFRGITWVSVAGIFFHIIAVISVSKRVRKTMAN